MSYDKIIKKILDSYLDFVSNKYYSLQDKEYKTGLNNYNNIANSNISNSLILDNFTSGKFEYISSSFLFVGVSSSNAIHSGYVGDSLGYNNSINLVVRVYKQTNDIFLAYNIIPIILNQISREWLYKGNYMEDFTIDNINISNAEPTFDTGNNTSINDFSSIKGVIVELNISFNFYSNNEED